jgi:hypothetical protein
MDGIVEKAWTESVRTAGGHRRAKQTVLQGGDGRSVRGYSDARTTLEQRVEPRRRVGGIGTFCLWPSSPCRTSGECKRGNGSSFHTTCEWTTAEFSVTVRVGSLTDPLQDPSTFVPCYATRRSALRGCGEKVMEPRFLSRHAAIPDRLQLPRYFWEETRPSPVGAEVKPMRRCTRASVGGLGHSLPHTIVEESAALG